VGAIATAIPGPDLLVETTVVAGDAAAAGRLGRWYRPIQKPMPAQSSIRKHVLRKFLFIELQLLRQDTPFPEIAKGNLKKYQRAMDAIAKPTGSANWLDRISAIPAAIPKTF
jgi:hypothetical protein